MIENSQNPQFSEGDFNEYIFKYLKEKETKKRYRNTALTVGIPYLISLVITLVWAKVYLFSATSLGVSMQEAIDFVNLSGVNELLQVFLSVLIFTLPFILTVILSGKSVSETVDFSKPKEKSVLPYFLLGVSFCLFANVAVSYADNIFQSFGIDYNVDFGENPNGFFGIMLAVISISIVPALVEEFAYRGVIFGLLKPHGDSFAVLTTAILFGVMHGNFEQMPFAVLVGIILGFVRCKTGSLWVCILIHFANNFISVCIDYLTRSVPMQILNVAYVVFVAFALLLFIPAVFLAEKRFKNDAFSISKGSDELKEREKFKVFFSSPIIIVPIILYGLEALKFFF